MKPGRYNLVTPGIKVEKRYRIVKAFDISSLGVKLPNPLIFGVGVADQEGGLFFGELLGDIIEGVCKPFLLGYGENRNTVIDRDR
ncbi:hypothetical protein ES703_113713 [subsurface metagenome]